MNANIERGIVRALGSLVGFIACVWAYPMAHGSYLIKELLRYGAFAAIIFGIPWSYRGFRRDRDGRHG